MKLRTTLLAAAALIGLTATSFAVPLSPGSTINIGAYVTDGDATTINNATSLFFSNALGMANKLDSDAPGGVPGSSFTGVPGCSSGTCGTISNIANINPGSFTPLTPFFSTTSGISFDLTSIVDVTRRAPTSSLQAELLFDGLGTLHYDGFDATPAYIAFTAQGNSVTVSFSSTASAGVPLSVPEPVSIALLGTSLAGLGVLRRFRRS